MILHIFLSPVPMAYAMNAWDHDLPFRNQEQLAYGSPSKKQIYTVYMCVVRADNNSQSVV